MPYTLLTSNAISVDRTADDKLNNSTHGRRHRNTPSPLSTQSKLDEVQPRRHPEDNSTPVSAHVSPMHSFTVRLDAAAVEQMRQVQTNAITSRNESYYSAAAILTIAGLFVALTMTASLALFVFWRKTNTVFVLQKCEQEDYANEDDDSNFVIHHELLKPMEAVEVYGIVQNIDEGDANESRVTEESDSDGAVQDSTVNKGKPSYRKMQSLNSNSNRWLLVSSEDCDAILRNSPNATRGRFTRRQSSSDKGDRYSVTTDTANIPKSVTADDFIRMTNMPSSISDGALQNRTEMQKDRTVCGSMESLESSSSTAVITETRFSFHEAESSTKDAETTCLSI